MAHTHRYSVHMTSPCVKLTTSSFLLLWFKKKKKTWLVYKNLFQDSKVAQFFVGFLSVRQFSLNTTLQKDLSGLLFLIASQPHEGTCERELFFFLPPPSFIPWKNVCSDLDMCRLAGCFPLFSNRLTNWKLCSCHLSFLWSLCFL